MTQQITKLSATLLLICFSRVVVSQIQVLQSPCPDVFLYESTAESDRWYGNVVLKNNEPIYGVALNIELDSNAESLGNWYGEVTTRDNRNFLITNSKASVLLGSNTVVRIFVQYRRGTQQIPQVKSISLNGIQKCPKVTPNTPIYGATVSSQGTNDINSSGPNARPNSFDNNYTSRPSSNNIYSNSDQFNSNSNYNNQNNRPVSSRPYEPNEDGFSGDFRPNQKPNSQTSRPSEIAQNSNYQCGTVEVQAKPLITNGQHTYEGQWPWHGAIYKSAGIDLTYICGASLITPNHVITAAHCVTKQNTEEVISRSTITVYLGKFNLKKWTGDAIQFRQVEHIASHPSYNHTNFDNDVAILRLTKPVNVTPYVRPVCLWDEDTNLQSIVGSLGSVIGWGYNENGHVTEELIKADMPVVSQETCIRSFSSFFSKFTSERTYCAGFRNGTSVCNGDSGGGMVFPKRSGNNRQSRQQGTVWQIRGIVSLSVALQNVDCDTSHYAVFTDLAKHLPWIKNNIK